MKYHGLAIIGILTSFAGATQAQENRSLTTEVFVQKAAVSNLFEIESSKLAIEKTGNAQVRQFAEQMVQDHQNAAKAMQQAVAASKLDGDVIPTRLDEHHEDKMAELRASSGEEFDENYLDIQEDAHEKAVRLYERFTQDGGQHAELQAFAKNTLPVLRRHEEHVDKLEDDIEGWWD